MLTDVQSGTKVLRKVLRVLFITQREGGQSWVVGIHYIASNVRLNRRSIDV